MFKTLLLLSALSLPLLPAWSQSSFDPTQNGASSQSSNCDDPSAPGCSASQNSSSSPLDNGSSQPGAYGDQMGTGGGAQTSPYGGMQSLGSRTGNQDLSQPEYRDENGLPNQQNNQRYRYQTLTPEPLTEFQKYVASSTGQVLPIFGSQLFRQVPSTFAPVDQIPVPPDATVGPGDLLRIRVWGQVNFAADLRVDRSGEIYLPQVGPVHVAGLRYADLDQQIHSAVARVYRNFNVSVDMGQIRSIQVLVVGRARRPGTYTVSSLSSLIDALFASGGPSAAGSLRHIQLKRGGKLVTDLDLYQLLVNGDKSGDTRLESGDVIYIPAVGPQVAVVGSVKLPAIYEESLPATIGDALHQAAGVTNVAGGRTLTIERMQNGEGRAAQQVAFTDSGMATPLADGDIVRVIPAVPSLQKTVTLRGNTANPGQYGWHPGMHLSEMFPDRQALLTRNYWWQRARLGLPAPEFERQPSLERLIQPNQPLTLPITPEDQERERQRQELLEEQRQYQLEQRKQAMAQNSDLPNGANGASGANGTNANGQNTTTDLTAAGAAGAAASGSLGMPPLDSTASGMGASPTQRLGNRGFGNDGGPQTAAMAQRDALTENTNEVQGITQVTLPAPEIDWSYAVIERLDPITLKTSLVPFDLGRLVMDHDASQDLELQPGDIVTVFSQADIHVPVEQQTRLVRLEGEFVHAGVYSVRPGETLRSVAERAGGLAPGAYLFGSEFSRVSVRGVQQRRLDEYVQNLQLQIERGVLATSSSAASSASDIASAGAAGAEARELVARLKAVRATGRIVLQLHPFDKSASDLPAISLEDGDTFYVPSVPSNVSVIGAVYDQNSFAYIPGAHVTKYMRLAGGANRDADKRHPFVIRADGSVISRDQVGERQFDKIIIQPGDTIVVSEKTFGPGKLRGFLDFSQLFSQLAIGAAVLTVLP